MKRKFFFEHGNWERAAEVLQQHQPNKFPTVDEAKDFLKSKVIEEFGSLPDDTLMNHEWIHGPIIALAGGGKGFVQQTPAGPFERVQILFWISLRTDNRSDVEILETSAA
jgi:hypothetical protein